MRNLIKKNPKYSKRINYDALKDLFVDSLTVADEKDNLQLYVMEDEKNDVDAMLLVEDEGGVVEVIKGRDKDALAPADEDEDADAEGDYAEGSDKGDEYRLGEWEEAYEQEV